MEGRSGAAGTRTPYLFNAIEALSQMSYSPTYSAREGSIEYIRAIRMGATWRAGVVGAVREPPLHTNPVG